MGRRHKLRIAPRLDLLYPLINDPHLINDPNPVAQPFLAVRLVKCPTHSPLPPSTTPSTTSASTRATASTSSLLSPPSSVDLVFADPPYFLSHGGLTSHSLKMVSVPKGDWP